MFVDGGYRGMRRKQPFPSLQPLSAPLQSFPILMVSHPGVISIYVNKSCLVSALLKICHICLSRAGNIVGTKIEGAALGMYISKKGIFEGHQGEIRVDNTLGEGSCFEIDTSAQ